MFLSDIDFSNIVRLAPLVSIDLCVLNSNKILIGKRKNPPAKDFFFVPGGRIRKGELKENALKRILYEELGYIIEPNKLSLIKELGTYEHFYKNNFKDNSDFSTHYVVLAYLVPIHSISLISGEILKNQHVEYKWQDINYKETNNFKIHKNTLDYFKNPEILEYK